MEFYITSQNCVLRILIVVKVATANVNFYNMEFKNVRISHKPHEDLTSMSQMREDITMS